MRFAYNLRILAVLSGRIGSLGNQTLGQEKGKIARPVDSEKSFERSTFQADQHQVYTLLFKILTKHGFDFVIKDKNLGRIETNYVVFSRHPEFSKMSNGVKSLADHPSIVPEEMDGWANQDIRGSAAPGSEQH